MSKNTKDEGENNIPRFSGACSNIWNAKRDKRPLFATTELEVEDIINGGTPDWAERLRDRLGLGHYSPGSASGPIEVILMRYTVQEVSDSLAGNGHPAIPTVLDGDMSHYFYPSPNPDPEKAENPYYGHTVNLAPVTDEGDYSMGVELLHPRIEYNRTLLSIQHHFQSSFQ